MTEQIWQERLDNLNNIWRKSSRPSIKCPANDYASHLRKVHLGKKVLDVGCGDQRIKQLILDHEYIGVDALPLHPSVINMRSENLDIEADTILCFAMLDGCQNLDKTLEAINKCAQENIVLLTCLEVEPDMFHTYYLTLEMIVAGLPDFTIHFKEEVEQSTWLIDFWRKND